MCKNIMEEEKTLKAYFDDWKYIMDLKTGNSFKKSADVLKIFVAHCRKAIKSGELKLR